MRTRPSDDFAKTAAVRIANAINRRKFLHKSAVTVSSGLAASMGVASRAEATHNYSVRAGCGPITYGPDGCGNEFGCGPSKKCHPDYCNGTHCTNGHSILTVCDGHNCWTWTVSCGSCGTGGGQITYRWTCCDCTCGNPGGTYCSDPPSGPARCICGTRELIGCL